MTILDRTNTEEEVGAQRQRAASTSDVATGQDAGEVTSMSVLSPPGGVGRTNEQSMGRAVRLGALIGIPATFLVTFLIGILGGAGLVASVAIGLWVGAFGSGTYLGAIFFLPSGSDGSGSAK